MSATKGIEESLELAEAAGQETVLVLTHDLKDLVLQNQLLRAKGTGDYLKILDELTYHWQETQRRQVENQNRLLGLLDQKQKELDAERSGRATKRTNK